MKMLGRKLLGVLLAAVMLVETMGLALAAAPTTMADKLAEVVLQVGEFTSVDQRQGQCPGSQHEQHQVKNPVEVQSPPWRFAGRQGLLWRFGHHRLYGCLQIL